MAVSGGPDSVALLLLARAALPGAVRAATVDHGLRSESAGEAGWVGELCGKFGIPHAVLQVEVPVGNRQAGARDARYRALADWARGRGLAGIATAHHADDQAETLLMRLNRGSGVAGLAGIRSRSAGLGGEVPVVRPLLGWRREELEAIVAAAGITPLRDPSNDDPDFDRVRIRRALADADWLETGAIARSAACLADANEALDWAAEEEWNTRVEALHDAVRYSPRAPRAIRLRVLARAIALLGGRARGAAVAELESRLAAGEGGTLGGVLVRPRPGGWVLTREPPRRSG